MVRCWLLVHSPLVGPDTWEPVADRLRDAGDEVVVPRVTMGGEPPFAERHAAQAAKVALAAGCRPVVVGHSAAGGLLGRVGQLLAEAGHPPMAYVLADAGLPADRAGTSRRTPLLEEAPDLAEHLDDLHAAGRRFPAWDDEVLRPLVADAARRRRLLDGVQPAPPAYWTEPLPVVAAWPDAPVGVLLFSASYAPTAERAAVSGWPVRVLADGNHFLPVHDPQAVAAALRSLADDLTRA